MTTTLKGRSKRVDKAEMSRQRYAKATQTLAARRNERVIALTEVEGITTAWATGEDSLNAAAMVAARAELDRTDALLAAAEREFQSADRGRITDEVVLASELASVLEEAVGVPVTVCNDVRNSTPEGPLPHLFLVQRKPTQYDSLRGTMHGVLEVLYRRSGIHRELPVDAIADAARAKGVLLVNRDGRSFASEGTVEDSCTFDVQSASPPIPLIDHDPLEWVINNFGQSVIQQGWQSFALYDDRESGVRAESSGEAGGKVPTVSVRGGDLVHVSTQRSDDGLRRVVVEVELKGHVIGASHWTADDITHNLGQTVERRAGEAHAFLGRIETAEVVKVEALARGRSVVGRFTFVSRPGAGLN